MSNKSNVQSGNLFMSLLLVLFIGLKLAGIGVVATWSWWWVLAPFWVPLTLAIVILVAFLVLHRLSK